MALRRNAKATEANHKYIKNLSTNELTDDHVGLISKGLKFIPTPTANEGKIRCQLLQDFENFATRMRLKYNNNNK